MAHAPFSRKRLVPWSNRSPDLRPERARALVSRPAFPSRPLPAQWHWGRVGPLDQAVARQVRRTSAGRPITVARPRRNFTAFPFIAPRTGTTHSSCVKQGLSLCGSLTARAKKDPRHRAGHCKPVRNVAHSRALPRLARGFARRCYLIVAGRCSGFRSGSIGRPSHPVRDSGLGRPFRVSAGPITAARPRRILTAFPASA